MVTSVSVSCVYPPHIRFIKGHPNRPGGKKLAYEDDNSSLDLTKFKEENATKNETSKSTVNKNKAQSLVFIPTHIENHTNMAGGKKLAYEDD